MEKCICKKESQCLKRTIPLDNQERRAEDKNEHWMAGRRPVHSLRNSSLHMMKRWRPGAAIVLFPWKLLSFFPPQHCARHQLSMCIYKSESKVNWGPVMQQHPKAFVLRPLCCCSDNEYSCDELIKSATFISPYIPSLRKHHEGRRKKTRTAKIFYTVREWILTCIFFLIFLI